MSALPRKGEIAMAHTGKNSYADGNAARRLPAPTRAKTHSTKRKVSQKAQKNRERALGMSWGFLFFLAVVCIAILVTGVQFLQMKSEVTAKTKAVANLEAELSSLKADNDAYYSQVMASVDLDDIKQKAIEKLGMKYPSDKQIMTYKTERSSYVRQYQDIDDTGR